MCPFACVCDGVGFACDSNQTVQVAPLKVLDLNTFSLKAIGKDLEGLLILGDVMATLFVGTFFAAYIVLSLLLSPL